MPQDVLILIIMAGRIVMIVIQLQMLEGAVQEEDIIQNPDHFEMTLLQTRQDNGHIDQILVQSYDLTILPYAVVVHDEACLLYPVGDLEYNA
jgi:hypothetical protein